MAENTSCTCKWKSCSRYGRCDECIQHHSTHPKHPLPFCKKREKTRSQGREDKPQKES